MKTSIIPTYKVSVDFEWNYAGQEIHKIEKTGLVSTEETNPDLIAGKFVSSFISNYEIGICTVNNINIKSVDRYMTFEEFEEKYKPLPNPFAENHDELNNSIQTMLCTQSFDDEEHDYILDTLESNPKCVWTLCEEGDDEYVIAGYWRINRQAYYVTEYPVQPEDKNTMFFVDY